MAIHYSNQAKSFVSPGYDPLRPNEMHGRVRSVYFFWNTTSGLTAGTTLAEDDLVILAKIPAGSRLLPGDVAWEAMGTSMTMDLGLMAVDGSGFIDLAGTVADDPDKLTDAAIDVAAAGQSRINHNDGDALGFVLEKECYLTLSTTNSSGSTAWAADKDVFGYLNYVLD